ncbi:MAG: hypothetical protein Q8P18_25435 [Pseudomonadota bacterium]|nr:hypothetical protein [Pseudomonadota bacterium]
MNGHTWRFFRAGGVDQVRLETADDLRNLGALDLKLWVALGCPVRGLEIDERMMALVDTDGDQRVRAPELLAAVAVVCRLLRDPAEILHSPRALPLASIRDDCPEGRAALASARGILAGLGRPAATEITVADVSDESAIFANIRFNGDGIVTEALAQSPEVASIIRDAVTCLGGDRDRAGAEGVTVARIEAFYAACQAFADWNDRATTEAAALFPLGADATRAAHAALEAVRAKVDDFFSRVRLAAFDARSIGPMNRPESEYIAIAGHDLSAGCTELEPFPLALVAPGRTLPLAEGVNPAWAARIEALHDQVVRPILGQRAECTAAEWTQLKGSLAPFRAWLAAEAGKEVASLGAARVAEIIAGDGKAQVLALVARDEERRPEAESIGDVERLVRYHANLGQLLRNFVNFSAFYGRSDKAVFQAGTVFLDQRSCELAIQVQDAGRHAAMAGLSGSYLVYLDCARKLDGRKMTVCAAITDGDSDNLMVGRNGLFYDRKGRDYDATITRIVDNPISLRQAFWSPYKKFLRALEDYISKRAAAAEAASHTSLNAAAEKVSTSDRPAPAPAAPAAPAKIDVGTVAAIGVAVGGITAALGAIMQAVFGLGMWMPLGLVGLLLAISGPSVFIAALKLRHRNIGPILDADGWALNTQARVNIPFGRSLTQLAALPPGAARGLRDPFAPPPARWPYVVGAIATILLVIIGLAGSGKIQIPGFPIPGDAPSATAPDLGAAPAGASTAPAAPAAP